MSRAKKILVTGGAGFIGSELVRQLAESGCETVVVDNLVTGKRQNLDGLDPDLVRFEEADIRESSRMSALLAGIDVVYHLACLGVRHSIHSPVENHEVNAAATLALLIGSREANVGRFVHVSSSEIYGTARSVPISESHAPFPETVYGSSKLAGECYARAFHRTYGMPTVVLRPFNAYGPRCHHEGDSGEVIPKFLLRSMAGKPMIVFGDGTQTRDFTWVGDIARGIMRAGTAPSAVGRTLNIGSGKEITIRDLAATVADVASHPMAEVQYDDPRPGDVLRLCADADAAKEALDWAPEVTLREGISRLRRWYEESGDSPERLLEDERVHNWKAEDDASDSA